MRILITRPISQAKEFKVALEAEGFSSVLLEPLLTINPILTSRLEFTRVGALIVTSQNAVDMLTYHQAPRDLTVFSVGARTAESLQKAGFTKIHIGPNRGDDLYPLILEHMKDPSQILLHPAGLFMKEELQTLLKESGYIYQAVPVYRADASKKLSHETEGHLVRGTIDVITFFSPRTADIFVKLTSQKKINRKNIIVCCASEQVAHRLNHTEWKTILIANSPNLFSMIELIKTIK